MVCAMTVRSAPAAPTGSLGPRDQEIKFCRAPDGVRLAYAIHGSGPVLVVASCWLSHLQYDWQSPVWRHFLDQLGSLATVVRYDERGFGLSDWTVDDFSLGARLTDLEAIVAAAGLERFAVLGMSGGSAVALAYAIAHPDRVSRLILNGTVCGEPVVLAPEELVEEETYRKMIEVGWAKEDPAFRRVFTTRFIPDATEEQMRWFDDLQRMSTSPANAVASRIARQQVDLEDDLPRIAAPTIVLQSIGDRSTTFDNAVTVSSLIPGARLVPLQSRNHILLADEPAWGVFIDEVEAFLEPERRAHDRRAPLPSTEALSRREVEVLRLAADGRTNDEIAAALTLSVRTVERHLSNVYAKLGLSGSAARAAAVAEYFRAAARLSDDAPGCVSTAIERSPTRGGLGGGTLPRMALRCLRSLQPPVSGGMQRRQREMSATVLTETATRFRTDPAAARSTPTVTATLANGRARLSAGPFNWDADLPLALGGENLAPSPTAYLLGALAGCGVAFLHDTLAPQFDVTIQDITAVARCSADARGLLGLDGAAPDLTDLELDIRVTSAFAGRSRRGDARGVAGAVPDLPRPPQAPVDRALDLDEWRRRMRVASRSNGRAS